MAKLSSKQLNTKLTGSYTFSGSSHSFIGDITADNNISASVSSTGSFGAISVAGMSVSNLVDVSSSISTRLSTEETNVDNLQSLFHKILDIMFFCSVRSTVSPAFKCSLI